MKLQEGSKALTDYSKQTVKIEVLDILDILENEPECTRQ